MFNYNKARCLMLRASLFTGLLLTAMSATAITIDGDLSDLQAAMAGEVNYPRNTAYGVDPLGSADSPPTESGNGFDIQYGYAWYDVYSKKLYLGMTFFGQVGTAGGNEGGALDTCPPLFNYATIAANFDGCESYGFSIDINNDGTVEYNLQMRGDKIVDSGEGTEGIKTLTGTLASTLTINAADWAVSESFNGVEFSLSGLDPYLQPYSTLNPRIIKITFWAGSVTNTAAEDTMFVLMEVVPVPAAAWLLGSGLVGLFGFSVKRKRH